MAKILLDIGAHLGETLEIARNRRWEFDTIWSFEPAPQCWPALDRLADDRTRVMRFGLWTENARLPLYDPGAIGASMFHGKGGASTSVDAEFRDAAAWFHEHVSASDEVLMKVNCEGAECDLLDHLLASGELTKVDELVVHFDVRKVPGQEHRERETRARLDAAGVPYRPAEAIFFGRNTQEKTANWLRWYHSSRLGRLRYSVLRRVEFAVRVPLWRLRQRRRAG